MTLDRNKSVEINKIMLTGVLSDHGEYSPDAIGVIIDIDGKKIYFTGDTCFRPDLPQLVPIKDKIDLLSCRLTENTAIPTQKMLHILQPGLSRK